MKQPSFVLVLLWLLMGGSALAQPESAVEIKVPESIKWHGDMARGLSYLISPTVINNSEGALRGLTLVVDGSDFVDNDLTIRVGDVNPGESKTIDVGSIFNEFILSWKGESPLFVSLTMRGVGPDGNWFRKYYKIPVQFNAEGQSFGKRHHSSRTTVHVASTTSKDDILGNKSQQLMKSQYQATMSRGEGPMRWANACPDALVKFGRQQKVADRKVLYGRILSVLGEPLAGVEISHRHIKGKAQSDIDGYFELPFLQGNTELSFNKDGYWDEEITLTISENRSVPLQDTILVPMVDEKKLYLLEQGRPLRPVEQTQTRIQGQMLNVTTTIDKHQPIVVVNDNQPSFLFIPPVGSEPLYGNNLVVSRIMKQDVVEKQQWWGESQVEYLHGNYIATGEHFKVTAYKVNEGKAYRIKVKDELPPGTYMLSNVMKDKTFFAQFTSGMRFGHAFKVGDFKAPQFVQPLPDPTLPIRMQGLVSGYADGGEEIVATVRLENTARAWYLVTLESDVLEIKGRRLQPVQVGDKIEYAFLIGPPTSGKGNGFVEFKDLVFPRNTYLKFSVSRVEPTVALVTTLDMIYRGLFNHRMDVKDLESYEKLADLAAAGAGKSLLAYGVVDAALQGDWGAVREIFATLKGDTVTVILDGAIKDSTFMDSIAVQFLKGFHKAAGVIGEIIDVPEKFDLMFELSVFTNNAPLDGSSFIYVK